ncbi:Polysaccharide deacetylase [Devosia sp. LC5]|uniref:polysaccharide deacetylase family protein n=1 Tax=Devosia sp. LC5 TaxID=1502724 RepID=UPI0004E458C5|nr:polysaccharide deacetylase family protein [Devosia sp. LC5]KFC67376.1 Polysaccharide deacetylase [Devosia sp. LC5]
MSARSTLGGMARTVRRLLGGERPLILMYHRIADLDHDPWELAVSPDRFAMQLQILRARRDIVPLSWLVERLERGQSAPRAAAITFDDGYVDLLDNAKPLLARYTCPATVFLPPAFVGQPGGFWWDTLTRIFLATPDLPAQLTLDHDGKSLAWDVRTDTRRKVHDEVWAALKFMGDTERAGHLATLVAWAGIPADAPASDRCMTEEQLRAFSQPGVLDFGAHTMSHPSLPHLAAPAQAEEISRSSNWIVETLGIEPQGLAFPFGDYNKETLAAARSSGVQFACTTVADAIRRRADRFALPRVAIGNLDTASFERLIASHG